jgi:hypothetical protein
MLLSGGKSLPLVRTTLIRSRMSNIEQCDGDGDPKPARSAPAPDPAARQNLCSLLTPRLQRKTDVISLSENLRYVEDFT